MDYTQLAEASLDGRCLDPGQMQAVLAAPDPDLLALLHAAFRVRHHHFGRRVMLHVLVNAKSGLCPEDCGYCSQSSVASADIQRYPLMSVAQLCEGALAAHRAGACRYCIVTSGRGPTDREVAHLAEAVRAIKARVDIEVCCSLGLLAEEQARSLKASGVDRVNHNLNTSRRHHEAVVGTHTYDDRVRTLGAVKAAGLSTCCGGIVGLGERREDVIDLALALRELDVDSIPVNFLHPIPGTPLQDRRAPAPADCLKALCLFRFLNPSKEIRVAGGRERNLRSLQPLALYPANSIFMDGYLTTPGQAASDAHRMIEDLGFEVEVFGSAHA